MVTVDYSHVGVTDLKCILLTGCFFCSGNMMKVLRGHQNWVYSCAFSPDSSMLCSVGASKAVCVKVLVHVL